MRLSERRLRACSSWSPWALGLGFGFGFGLGFGRACSSWSPWAHATSMAVKVTASGWMPTLRASWKACHASSASPSASSQQMTAVCSGASSTTFSRRSEPTSRAHTAGASAVAARRCALRSDV